MRSKDKANIKLSDFPEEVTKDGVRIFGETSYENHLAVLSHYLHNGEFVGNTEKREYIISLIREYLQEKTQQNYSDEEIAYAAENPTQYNLFGDFFNVPFPAPKVYTHTFVD